MRLTKQQRNEVYKRACEKMYDAMENDLCLFICPRCCESMFELVNYHTNTDNVLRYLPELRRKRPNRLYDNCNMIWFHERDYFSRIEVLEACIRETNPKRK